MRMKNFLETGPGSDPSRKADMRKDLNLNASPSLNKEDKEVDGRTPEVARQTSNFQYDRGKEKDAENGMRKGKESSSSAKLGMYERENAKMHELRKGLMARKLDKDLSNRSFLQKKADADMKNQQLKSMKEKMGGIVSDNRLEKHVPDDNRLEKHVPDDNRLEKHVSRSEEKKKKIKIISGDLLKRKSSTLKQSLDKLQIQRLKKLRSVTSDGKVEETMRKEFMVVPIENEDLSEKRNDSVDRHGMEKADIGSENGDFHKLDIMREVNSLPDSNRAIEQYGDCGELVANYPFMDSLEYRMENTLHSKGPEIKFMKCLNNMYLCLVKEPKTLELSRVTWPIGNSLEGRTKLMKESLGDSDKSSKKSDILDAPELKPLSDQKQCCIYQQLEPPGLEYLRTFVENIRQTQIQTRKLGKQMETLRQYIDDIAVKGVDFWGQQDLSVVPYVACPDSIEGESKSIMGTSDLPSKSLRQKGKRTDAKLTQMSKMPKKLGTLRMRDTGQLLQRDTPDGDPAPCNHKGLLHVYKTIGTDVLQRRIPGEPYDQNMVLLLLPKGRHLARERFKVRRVSGSDHSSPQDSGGGNGRGSRSQANFSKGNDETSEKESRNQDDEKDRDEKEEMSESSDHQKVPSFSSDGNGVCGIGARYKYRRKHGHLPEDGIQLVEMLGWLEKLNEDIPPDILQKLEDGIPQVNNCLIICLKKPESLTEDEDCAICVCLSGMIQHFGRCQELFSASCKMCRQSFQLILSHIKICMQSSRENECPVLVCRKILYLVSNNPDILHSKAHKIWRKLKKFMAGFVDDPQGLDLEREEYFSLTSLNSISTLNPILNNSFNSSIPPRAGRRGSLFASALPIISEDFREISLNLPVEPSQQNVVPTRLSKSEPICRRRPDGEIEYFKQPTFKPPKNQQKNLNGSQDGAAGKPIAERPSKLMLIPGAESLLTEGRPPTPAVAGPPMGLFQPKSSLRSPTRHNALDDYGKRPLRVSFSRETKGIDQAPSLRLLSLDTRHISDIVDDAFGENPPSVPQSTIMGEIPTEHGPLSDASDPYSIEDSKTYGNRMMSLQNYPMTFKDETQILSLKERPTGTPGIGEVVYGTRSLLLVVIKHWNDLKMEYKNNGRLLRKYSREEGIIFPEWKKQLMIMKNRYQKNFQWIRLTHLGRGMSGNCHLASDYNSDYQFCIKKIHISKYQQKELEIWSDLQHDNIVKLHGALRRGEKIYILSEFIAGGSLLEAIKQQKGMMRRLSQWTALKYLKQMLIVLIYLQRKAVIHEDLKADNILLRENSQTIVVGDFGTAVKVTGATTRSSSSVPGTPTQFSPEKAQGTGHGFKSDLWSAICVLFHMLSGDPPWIKRYPNAKPLNFIIVTNDPPFQDIPDNVSQDVVDLIKDGFQKDPVSRPSAQELLQHKAFKLLDDNPDTFTSVLLTSAGHLPNTKLPVQVDERDQGECLSILNKIEESLSMPAPKIQSEALNKVSITEDNSVTPGTLKWSEVTGEGLPDERRLTLPLNINSLMPSAEENKMHLKKYLEDNSNEITAEAEVTMPTYTAEKVSEPDNPHGNSGIGSVEIENFGIPNLDIFNLEQVHIYKQQSSHTSNSDDDHSKSIARSTSQPYSSSEVEIEYRKMQETIITDINESQENYQSISTATQAIYNIKEENALEENVYHGTGMEEPISSLNLPNLTPLKISSGEKTITATGGNLPNMNMLFKSSSTDRTADIHDGKSDRGLSDPDIEIVNRKQSTEDEVRKVNVGDNGPHTLPANVEHASRISDAGPDTLPAVTHCTMFEEEIPSFELFPQSDSEIYHIDNNQGIGSETEAVIMSSNEGIGGTDTEVISTRQDQTGNIHDLDTESVKTPYNKGIVDTSTRNNNTRQGQDEGSDYTQKEEEFTQGKRIHAQGQGSRLTLKVNPGGASKRRSDPTAGVSSPILRRLTNDGDSGAAGYEWLDNRNPLVSPDRSSGPLNSTKTPPSATSNRSQSQLDESDEALQEMMTQFSQPSNGSLEYESEDEEECYDPSSNNYDESLSYAMNHYITENTDESSKEVKVNLIQLDGQKLSFKLPAEYSKGTWKKIVEMDFSEKIHLYDCKKFTLETQGGAAVDLGDSPIETLGDDSSLTLQVIEVSDNCESLPWYCESGICKTGAGIPL